MQSDEWWLRTNERVEAVKALRACREHLARGLVDAYGLTMALQSFIVDTFRNGGKNSCLGRFSVQAVRGMAARRGRPGPIDDVRMPAFLEPCKKLRDDRGWQPADETWEHLERLRDVRNVFTHFNPKAWSIQAGWLRSAIRAGLEGIQYVIERQPGHFRWDDPELERTAAVELRAAQRLAAEPDETCPVDRASHE